MPKSEESPDIALATSVADRISIGDEKIAVRQADAALQFLRQEEPVGQHDEIAEKKLLRKIDWLIMPLLFGCYLFQYMDKSLINYANVMGLSTDTHMTTQQFSDLATVFFITFIIFQPLHGYLMQKFPVAKYLGVNVILWGVIVCMHCVCKNFAGLVTVRLLLGVFEACVTPCLLLVVGMWYKRSEQPLRCGSFYLGVGSGTIIGAITSYGFQFYTAKVFKSWQIMYLIYGLVTIIWGGLIIIYLPDTPMSAKLFSHSEKLAAIERLRANQTGIENKTFKVSQMRETLLDYRTWVMALLVVTGNIPTGAVQSYSSTLIKGFGYDSKTATLLNIPTGAAGFLAALAASYFAGRLNSRGLFIIVLLLPGILGGALMAFLPSGNQFKGGKLAGIYMTAIFGPNLAISYSWVAANYAGHTKKITMNAIVLMAYGLASLIGPLTFTGASAPGYLPAKVTILVALAAACTLSLFLILVYKGENKKRDQKVADTGTTHVQDIEFMDLTDKENPEFRYAI